MCADYIVHGKKDENSPSYTLHTTNGMLWSTILTSPFSAGILMAINYFRTGNKKASLISVLLTIVIFIILSVGYTFLPEDNLVSIYILPFYLFVYIFAYKMQSGMIYQHIKQGGIVAASWQSIGVGILSMIAQVLIVFIVVAVLFFATDLFEDGTEDYVEVGGNYILYIGDATQDDASMLGFAVHELRIFKSSGNDIWIEKTPDLTMISFVINEDKLNDPETIKTYKNYGKKFLELFPGPMEIEFLNDDYETLNTITIQ